MDDSDVMIYLFIYVVLFPAIGAVIGQRKGRVAAGMLFGLLIGPFGWLLVGFGPSKKAKCSQCGGVLADNAIKCMHCGATVGFDPREYERMRAMSAARSHGKQIRVVPAKKARTIACPLCSFAIPEEQVMVGPNTCPSCLGAFDAQE